MGSYDDKFLQQYYEKNRARFSTREQVHARHILVKTRELAEKILHKLQQGEEFAKLAKQYSEDRGSRDRGGDIGSFTRGRMAPAFEKAAFSLQRDGDISAPIKTRFGYHIIERLAHTAATTKPFAEVEKQIRQELQQQEFRRWVESVKREMGLTVVAPRYQRGGPHTVQHRTAPTHP
ncbi:MAG: peptidylprolyl isomerase [Mariprofundales bacterium]|nr:peptidylprolyl isomerase [Mariprofundales bacterium]